MLVGTESLLRRAVSQATSGQAFPEDEMAEFVTHLMNCDLENPSLRILAAAFLCSLKTRGESIDEIVGAAKSLREHQVHVEVTSPDGIVLDTCGTGGDGAHLINISTITGIVVASLGVTVAKHGNRSVSSACGSADLLEALDYPLHSHGEFVSQCARETGFGFLFAPNFHPALKNLAGLRRDLGVRTLFNMLGPLVNPATTNHQLIGVFDRNIVTPIAVAASRLGLQKCVVVHGEGGLDELCPYGTTWVSYCEGGRVQELEWTPKSFGTKAIPISALAGGDSKENASISRSILAGRNPEAASAIAMNAAACLWLTEKELCLKAAYQMSYEMIQSGKAGSYFERCTEFARTLGTQAPK